MNTIKEIFLSDHELAPLVEGLPMMKIGTSNQYWNQNHTQLEYVLMFENTNCTRRVFKVTPE